MNNKVPQVDPVTVNILGNGFLSIALEMGTILLTSSYSSLVREGKDTSSCLLDPAGRIVSQAPMIPTHMNSMALAFAHLRSRYDLGALRPDDAFVLNNPYDMGQHLNDIILFVPAFYEEHLMGFTGTVVHHVDIGGGAPAANAYATELYQEGLILPAMKVSIERDLKDGLITQILAANVRAPDKVLGDFHAQLSAALRGVSLLYRMIDRYGRQTVLDCMTAVQDYSERVMRAGLSEIPDGIYEGEDFVDSQDPKESPVRVHVKASVRGDEVEVDLSGSDDEVSFPINAPIASVHAAVFSYFVSMTGEKAPVNDGSYRPVTTVTRPGSICNPHFPAPVRSRMAVCYRVMTALKRAFGEALPDRIPACGADSTTSIAFGHRRIGGFDVCMEVLGGGNGGWSQDDGEDCVAQGLSNTANTPIEALETEYDFVRVQSYGLRLGSPGHGCNRGGHGVRKVYEVLCDDVTLSTAGDRHSTRPWGLAGGGEGSYCRYRIQRGGERIAIGALTTCSLTKGDLVICETSGGAGWGDPRKRSRGKVLDDIAAGWITAEQAREIYGIAE